MSILALFFIVSVILPMGDFCLSSSRTSLFVFEDNSANLVEGVCSTVESVKSLVLISDPFISSSSSSPTSLGE